MNKISVIIPAAGKATRMRPLSNSISKAMIPVNGKPIVSYIIEHLFKISEPVEIIIVQNELQDIENFVKNAYPNYYQNEIIRFVQQEKAEGPLHAIKIGSDNLKRNQIVAFERHNEESEVPVLVWLGDTICLEENFNFNENFLVVSPVQDFQRWCMVDEYCNFYDKPEIQPVTDKALIGIYYFHNPKVYQKALDEGMNKPKYKGEYQISSLLDSYLAAEEMFDLEVTEEWYDCGELRTYYESKAKLLNRSARAFNNIKVDTFFGTVIKTSTDKDKSDKIENEKQWFLKLPQKSSLFCPRVLNSEEGILVMSQEPGTPLNETWLYENLRYDIWTQIIDKLLKIHNEVFLKEIILKSGITKKEKANAMTQMYLTKNLKRLEEYKDWENYELVYNFVEETAKDLIAKGCKWTPYLHGDSHLGNILFEPMQGSMKLVDPRGSFGDILGSQGDMRYDMAKITQDFYMNYADILSGNFKIEGEENKKIVFYKDTKLAEQLTEYLKTKLTDYGYDWKQIFKLSIVLIVTCIPFHYDNPERQKAFWLHAINRIQEFK